MSAAWELSFFSLLVGALFNCPEQVNGASNDNLMVWHLAKDKNALCNDYSRAGFFLRNTSSTKWVIFLESGSLCFSNETCNRRFFRSQFRPSGDEDESRSLDSPYGDFNPAHLFEDLSKTNKNYSEFVNPLMTSMNCLPKKLFNSSNGQIAVEGRDFLSADENENQDFYTYNHVLIPYCSSDLWLASEIRNNSPPENEQCGPFKGYEADSPSLQFAFRGKIIFQSIFKQLMEDHRLYEADSILLGGSSAGGVGVLNLAQWVRDTLSSITDMHLLIDSAWFINFKGSIAQTFEESTEDGFSSDVSDTEQMNNERLLEILYSHSACNDLTYGFPCCISAQCMLTQRNESGQLSYFPEIGVRMFFVSSVYDIFLLAPSVIGDDFNVEDELKQTRALVNFLVDVGEYGGEMNRSYSRTFRQEQPSFTYYLTQCFQHIYFATSSLWGNNHDNDTVFGTSSIGPSNGLASFSHSIQPNRWTLPLAYYNGSPISIKQAIHLWHHGAGDRFLDNCQGPYCNDKCPDSFTLGVLNSNNWPVRVKIIIAAIVIGIGMVCLFMKFMFRLWLYRLEKKQDDYLEQLDSHLQTCNSHLEFPDCDEEKAVAVSCLNLNYTITYKTNKNFKDERTDKTDAIVLNELTEQQREAYSKNPNVPASHRVSRQLHRRSKFVQITENLISSIHGSSTNLHTLHDVETGIEMATPPPPGYIPPAPPPPPLPDISAPPDEPDYNFCGCQKTSFKHILKDVSIYFNPGEMIGIMGPSGCGKTTFLDLLTGRRKIGTRTGNIYINGIPMEEIQDWYVANTGYVLQLARPFYEELTVRDNLTLAAEIKLPVSKKFTTKEKFKRVEQVMEVTGLSRLADTVVGGETGPGLSGGQKRRLVVALQLLRLPSVIFLDEPTSGLDATSSMELLSHLNKLADSNRTVILTIHQPRLEIFHMFHKLVLLSDGKVAYHGAPEKSYEVFVSALRARYLEQGLIIPSLEDHNPADVIMDMLGNPSFRRVLTEYYQESQEPKLVRQAIKLARFRQYDKSQSSMDSLGSAFGLALHGARKVGRRHANMFVRMAALEARAAKRLNFFQILFLPMMFFVFATVLGTVYFQQRRAFLVISGMCVFSVASGLFVFPAIEPYYTPALRVYRYERGDGVGQSQDLIFQGFIRYISVAFLPVICSCTLIYFLLVNKEAYDPLVYVQVVLVNLCLNFTWTALLIALLMAFPTVAFRISSAVASVAGFTSGFFIPIENINWAYRWMAYINPNYYGLSSVAFLILEDFNICKGNQLTCYLQSGPFTLKQFFFDEVNPYLHIVILLSFMTFFLCVAVFANWVKDTSLWTKLRRIFSVLINKPVDELSRQIKQDKEGFKRSISVDITLDDDNEVYEEGLNEEEVMSPVHEKATTPLYPIAESEEEDEEEEKEQERLRIKRERAMSMKRAKGNWLSLAGKSMRLAESQEEQEESQENNSEGKNTVRKVQLNDTDPSHHSTGTRPTNLKLTNGTKVTLRKNVKTPFLREGETHFVWRPKKRPQLSDLVDMLKNRDEEDERLEAAERKANEAFEEETTPVPRTPKPVKVGSSFALPKSGSLRTRQQALFNRVIATQAVLKESTDELLKEEEPPTPTKPKHMSLLEASRKVTANIKKQKKLAEGSRDFSDIVSEYLAKTKAEGKSAADTKPVPPKTEESGGAGSAYKGRMSVGPPRKPIMLQRRETKGAIPISTFREIVREGKLHPDGSLEHPVNKRNSAGPYLFASDQLSTASPANTSGSTPSLVDGEVVTLDPPPPAHTKMNKMAKLKKTVAERRPQRQEDVDTEVLSDMANMDSAVPPQRQTSNENWNNNNNRDRRRRNSAGPRLSSDSGDGGREESGGDDHLGMSSPNQATPLGDWNPNIGGSKLSKRSVSIDREFHYDVSQISGTS